ncbi:cold-shock protein [Nocardia terrae]|uniref:cold-shock protein n=1 Tax=Nocardia terrae TaxID=2675851 RepID=UPI0038B38160
MHTAPATEPPRWRAARVSWYDTTKGFGFLTPATGPDVFVDYTAIDLPGFKTLTTGQPVIFTATDTPHGPEATRVIPYRRERKDAHTRSDAHRAPGRRRRCFGRAA